MRIVGDEREAEAGRPADGGGPPPPAKLSVLMPVYNECWTLREIVGRVLAAPVGIEIELVIVDDASRDGSWELIQELAAADPRIKAVRHPHNRGKGAAVRTAISQCTGDVAVVQDADLEYDPREYARLLEPIRQGRADAVFGSRFIGDSRRVMFFWHAAVNKFLTLLSNMVNNLDLSDMEICYKMIRCDVLKRLRLRSTGFTFEPEVTCRLAQWGARVCEVPVSYAGRSYEEGKKIRARDGFRAIAEIIRCKFFDPQFTDHAGLYAQKSLARSNRYNRWLVELAEPYLGRRILEAGAGIGNLSRLLLGRSRLVLAESDPLYLPLLRQRFAARSNVRIDRADLTRAADFRPWQAEKLDTVLCANVLQQLEADEQVLDRFFQTLEPGGHCIVVVPAGRLLYTPLDRARGHCRRYTPAEAVRKMTAAGFEVVHTRRFGRLAAIAWALAGHLFRSRGLSRRQMLWSDRLIPLARTLERLLPLPGMSLLIVGRKPLRAAQRMVA
ncbi:MAG: glycosyltransferase [Thermoguttaceae bacterium]